MAWRESPGGNSYYLALKAQRRCKGLTKLVDVFLVLPHFFRIWGDVYIFVLANGCPAFCEDDKFMSRNIVMFYGLADDLLWYAVRVVVRSIPLFVLAKRFWPRTSNLTVLSPRSYAAFNRGSALSSSRIHDPNSDDPILIPPRIGAETQSPLLPSRL